MNGAAQHFPIPSQPPPHPHIQDEKPPRNECGSLKDDNLQLIFDWLVLFAFNIPNIKVAHINGAVFARLNVSSIRTEGETIQMANYDFLL